MVLGGDNAGVNPLPNGSPEAMPHLGAVGLHPGDVARYRLTPAGRWRSATITGVAGNGMLTLCDASGTACSVHFAEVEVLRRIGRGKAKWLPVADVAVVWEQLPLFSD